MSENNSHQIGNLKQALVAGACAGTAVDTALFPLGRLAYQSMIQISMNFDS